MRLSLLKDGEIRQENVQGNSIQSSEIDVSHAEVVDAAQKLYNETYNSFFLFLEKIFSYAVINRDEQWISGDYIKTCADFLQENRRTMYVGPRGHFKSFRFYAYIMWILWKNKVDKKNISIAYISFNSDLAALHIGHIKDLIYKSFLPTLGLEDLDKTATSKARYVWKDEDKILETLPIIEIRSYGAMGGIRGLHPNYIFIDDPYQDETKDKKTAAEPATVRKINEVFNTKIIPMPKENDEIHIIGTPQSWSDLWFQEKRYGKKDLSETEKFMIKIEPAYLEYDELRNPIKTLWPELFPLKILLQRQDMQGPSEFRQEYLCEPRVSTDSYFEKDRIEKSIDFGREAGLINYDIHKDEPENRYPGMIVAGYDPGKSKHPAHFAVFSYVDDKLIQLHSKWFDGWDYAYTSDHKPSQLKYIADAIEFFGIHKIYTDNTNGVMTTTIEGGKIRGMVECKITRQMKHSIALELGRVLGKPQMKLLDDLRQRDSLLAVQTNLDIMETKTSHGEAFTTLGFIVLNTIAPRKSEYVTRIKIKTEKDNMKKMYRGFFFERNPVRSSRLPFPTRRDPFAPQRLL